MVLTSWALDLRVPGESMSGMWRRCESKGRATMGGGESADKDIFFFLPSLPRQQTTTYRYLNRQHGFTKVHL